MAKSKPRMVQDDERQKQIADLCGLTMLGSRSGVDAVDSSGRSYEIKSTTTRSVSTARDAGLSTIKKWRTWYWIIASGQSLQKGYVIEHLYIAHPDDLKDFLNKHEAILKKQRNTFRRVFSAAKRGGALSEDLAFVVALFDRRGNTINNPPIPLKLVAATATELDVTKPQSIKRVLRAFVKSHPI